MKIRLIASMVAAASVCGASAQTTQQLSTSKANEYGLTYSLPETVVDITIETRHTRQTPGEFYNYAKRYLGITDVIVVPSSSAEIESVVVEPRGVARPGEAYLVKFKNGSNVSMTLTDSDVPLAINTDRVEVPSRARLPVAQAAAPTPLQGDAARQAVTQEMSATSSLSRRAELAAQRIFELRDTRNELLSGNADNMPPDGQAMKLVLDNIAAQEAALMAMFAGTTSSYTTVSTITYRPGLECATDTVIARLSPVDGLVRADDLSGDPVTLTISDIVRGELPLNDKGQPRTFPKGGVAYNIPGSAVLTLSVDGRQLAVKPIEVSQFGMTFGLDPALFTDKKKPSYVLFSPITGAIVRLAPVDQQ